MAKLAMFVSLVAVAYAEVSAHNTTFVVPPNSVFVDPLSFAVLGSSGPFRNSSELFNPTGTPPPFFQIFDKSFLTILGTSPSVRVIAENDTFAFAHEAPIWNPRTDEVFFASSFAGPLAMSDINHNNQISKISLKDVGKTGIVQYTKIPLADDIQMTNGGTPFRDNLLFVNAGRGNLPPNVVLVNPLPPYNSTAILDNFFGRQFNSLDDVKIHPQSQAVFFTDVTYGSLLDFRPTPMLPNQVYRFAPDTGEVRVVADGFDRCNGIAFSSDGQTAYVTDTGALGGFTGSNETAPATIYAFDVDTTTQVFKNRRVFAYVDNGIPDGIQLDNQGNVYSGCGDGTQVWNPQGTLLGKIFLGTTSSNMAFAGPGRLVIMADTKIFLAEIAATGNNLIF